MAVAKVLPLSLAQDLARDAKIAMLKDQIFALWTNDRRNRFALGKLLAELQGIYGKPGQGTFLKVLEELEIPVHTAYRRIKYFHELLAGVEDLPTRLLQNANDAFRKSLADETELVDYSDAERNALLIAFALDNMGTDQTAMEFVAKIEEQEKVVSEVRSKAKDAPEFCRIVCELPKRERKEMQAEWKALVAKRGGKEAAMIVLAAIKEANRAGEANHAEN